MCTKPNLILIIFAGHCAHNMTEGELRENKYGCNAYWILIRTPYGHLALFTSRDMCWYHMM